MVTSQFMSFRGHVFSGRQEKMGETQLGRRSRVFLFSIGSLDRKRGEKMGENGFLGKTFFYCLLLLLNCGDLSISLPPRPKNQTFLSCPVCLTSFAHT